MHLLDCWARAYLLRCRAVGGLPVQRAKQHVAKRRRWSVCGEGQRAHTLHRSASHLSIRTLLELYLCVQGTRTEDVVFMSNLTFVIFRYLEYASSSKQNGVEASIAKVVDAFKSTPSSTVKVTSSVDDATKSGTICNFTYVTKASGNIDNTHVPFSLITAYR